MGGESGCTGAGTLSARTECMAAGLALARIAPFLAPGRSPRASLARRANPTSPPPRRRRPGSRAQISHSRVHIFSSHADRCDGEMEKVSFGDAGIPGYECGDKAAPGVIVLQEWWGVTENIKKQALFISTKVNTARDTRWQQPSLPARVNTPRAKYLTYPDG